MVLQIDPKAIKAQTMSGNVGGAASTGKDFNAFLGGMNAMGPAAVTATNMYSPNPNAPTVLSAAFSGTTSYQGVNSGYAPTMAGGWSGYSGRGQSVEQMMGLGYGTAKAGGMYDPGGGVVGGGEAIPGSGVQTGELVNTMNQNNLQL